MARWDDTWPATRLEAHYGDRVVRCFSERPASLAENAALCANDLRRSLDRRFALRRRTAETEAYTQSFEQARELMARRDAFDVTKEPAAD